MKKIVIIALIVFLGTSLNLRADTNKENAMRLTIIWSQVAPKICFDDFTKNKGLLTFKKGTECNKYFEVAKDILSMDLDYSIDRLNSDDFSSDYSTRDLIKYDESLGMDKNTYNSMLLFTDLAPDVCIKQGFDTNFHFKKNSGCFNYFAMAVSVNELDKTYNVDRIDEINIKIKNAHKLKENN